MPEYLAPGVYVEETSFRANSIEGVSTSTTGFVGPTRRGPVAHDLDHPGDLTVMPDPPELLTSFGDFQRIYGSFDDLEYGLNYLAHSVRAYFDNGGSRLYVARIYSGNAATAHARSADLGAGLRFVARTPGAGGRGTITVFPHFADVTKRSMDRAPEGTTLRIGGKQPARGAKLVGAAVGPFTLPRNGLLVVRLNADATDTEISLSGEPAEVKGAAPLGANITLQADALVLAVEIDGVPQQIALPAGPTPRAQLVDLINSRIVGGYASLTTAAPADHLAIGSDVQGSASRVTVRMSGAGAALGFAADASDAGGGDLPNVRRVGAADLSARLSTATGGELTATSDADGHLVLTTATAAANARIQLQGGDDTVNALLGFSDGQTATGSAGAAVAFYVKQGTQWIDGTGAALPIGALADGDAPGTGGAEFVTVGILAEDGDGIGKNYEDLGLAPAHPRFIGTVLAATPSRRADHLENVFAFEVGTATAAQIRTALITGDTARAIRLDVDGTGAVEPQQIHYEAGLRALAQIEGISIVAAPGESAYTQHQGIQAAIISHCERPRRYRIAVLDTAPGLVISEAQTERSRIDSTYASLYYPWVVVTNPLARPGDENIPREIALPPSGFVCGIFVRTDVDRGVFKAPANEVVRGALRYEVEVNFNQQEVLNPIGVNCLRFFPGRSNRLWGARTASSDSEWKYVNVRRYFNYVERSIDVNTQWAVFEPNGERLWANIRETISSFLVNEWRSGALLGDSPKEAFFVRCDRSTMDQNDLDNGRLICVIGIAVVKPAEFVIFRIGQKTAEARS